MIRHGSVSITSQSTATLRALLSTVSTTDGKSHPRKTPAGAQSRAAQPGRRNAAGNAYSPSDGEGYSRGNIAENAYAPVWLGRPGFSLRGPHRVPSDADRDGQASLYWLFRTFTLFEKGRRMRFAVLNFLVIALLGTFSGVVKGADIAVPGDYPTIRAAVMAARNGDSVLLDDGIYTGASNRNIEFQGKAITVRSASGQPENCVIDVEGVPNETRRAFWFNSGEGPSSVIRDVSIINGVAGEA